MNEIERWKLFGGAEPPVVAAFLDALRDLPPATPEDAEQAADRFFAAFDAEPIGSETPDAPEPPRASSKAAPAPVPAPVPAPAPAPVPAPASALSPVSSFVPIPSTTPSPSPLDPDRAPASERESGIWPTHLGAPPEPSVPAPPVVRPPVIVTRTQELSQDLLPPPVALPFRPPSPDKPSADKTVKLAVMQSKLGETEPASSAAIQEVVATLPFPKSVAEPTVVPIPDLSLEQYASLLAELEIRPWRTKKTLLEYGVFSQVMNFALQAHWRKHLDAHPDQRARLKSLLAQYKDYVRALPA